MLTRLGRDILRQTRFLRLTRASAACSTFLRSPQKNEFHNLCRDFSVFSKSPDYSEVPLMDLLVYETLSTETLESLTDYFEQIVDTDAKLKSADVVYSVNFNSLQTLTNEIIIKISGRSFNSQTWTWNWNIRDKSSNTEPSNLAEFANFWS